jgi:hypothetical protein
MSFEKSPSLDDYKEGLPENRPDLSGGKKRMRIVLGIVFSIALILAIANFWQSETASLIMGTGSVQGIAVDAQGSPFAGDVFVVGVDQIAKAASDGSFLLERIPAGSHTLVVADAAAGWEYPIKIIAGQTTNIGQVKFISTAIPGQ